MIIRVAWGQKVSRTFLDRVFWIVEDLDIGYGVEDGVNKLMGCMGWESGRTFSAKIVNKAGSGATGLIQFMPTTAKGLGTTCEALARMTPEDQLNYVWKYFSPYKGKLKTLSDLYMAILWPKAVGKPETAALWTKASMPTTFRQNAGLDSNKDYKITKGEAAAKVAAVLNEGFKDKYVLEVDLGNETGKLEKIVRSAPIVKQANEILNLDVEQVVREVVETKVVPYVVEEVHDAVAPTTTSVLKKAASGWQGNFAGAAAIAGALLLNPDFSAALGAFTLRLSKGEGGWGALIALAGAALVAYRSTRPPH